MWRTADGSTGRLVQLCIGYFVTYVITGLTVKYYLGSADEGLPGMTGVEFLLYSTLGGTLLATGTVLVLRWYRIESQNPVTIAGVTIPGEFLYIVPSGICTGVIIPTTTLMYTLPISVMVAMVIMRGSVIVIGRIVDTIQIRQGLLHKKVFWEENVAVLFAVAAVATNVFGGGPGGFEFLRSVPAMSILGSYIAAYSLRIYIMNYYKNTRTGGRQNNKPFFAVEQITSTILLTVVAIVVFHSPSLFGWTGEIIEQYRGSITNPLPQWKGATVAGAVFGVVAFFSVFLFMFRGRTATFAGLVNRLTSLIAGTVSTLLFAAIWGGRWPSAKNWISLLLIFVAIGFLTRSERKRVAELRAAHEIDDVPPPKTR